MRRLVLFAIAIGTATTFAASATADVCAGATVTVPGPVIAVGPFCVPVGGSTSCRAVGAGTDNLAAEVTVCFPTA